MCDVCMSHLVLLCLHVYHMYVTSSILVSDMLVSLTVVCLMHCSLQRKVCKACYRIIEVFLQGDSRKNELYVSRFVPFFEGQVRLATLWSG